MALSPQDAHRLLVESGYFVDNGAGWHRAVKPPSRHDLAWYVAAVAKLGAYSVALPNSRATVELSTGSLPDEILFRVPERAT